MTRFCFITDGGLRLGMGHVQQSTTLAKELVGKGEVRFVTKSEEPVLELIRRAGFEVVRFADDAEILAHLAASRPDVVIFDKLDVSEDLARSIKSTLGCKLVIFTNLTAANRHADFAVTADIGSRFQNVRYVDRETGTTYCYGPKYWVLRKEFHEYRRRGKTARRDVHRILAIFGGSDPANVTSVVLDEILGLNRDVEVEVVLGASFGHQEAVDRVLHAHEDRRERVRILRNITDVAERMYRADLVLASPGLSAFEALVVGTPLIVIPQDELQRVTYDGFIRMITRDEVANLGKMIEEADFTFPVDKHIVEMEIGRGVDELVAEICRPKGDS